MSLHENLKGATCCQRLPIEENHLLGITPWDVIWIRAHSDVSRYRARHLELEGYSSRYLGRSSWHGFWTIWIGMHAHLKFVSMWIQLSCITIENMLILSQKKLQIRSLANRNMVLIISCHLDEKVAGWEGAAKDYLGTEYYVDQAEILEQEVLDRAMPKKLVNLHIHEPYFVDIEEKSDVLRPEILRMSKFVVEDNV